MQYQKKEPNTKLPNSACQRRRQYKYKSSNSCRKSVVEIPLHSAVSATHPISHHINTAHRPSGNDTYVSWAWKKKLLIYPDINISNVKTCVDKIISLCLCYSFQSNFGTYLSAPISFVLINGQRSTPYQNPHVEAVRTTNKTFSFSRTFPSMPNVL